MPAAGFQPAHITPMQRDTFVAKTVTVVTRNSIAQGWAPRSGVGATSRGRIAPVSDPAPARLFAADLVWMGCCLGRAWRSFWNSFRCRGMVGKTRVGGVDLKSFPHASGRASDGSLFDLAHRFRRQASGKLPPLRNHSSRSAAMAALIVLRNNVIKTSARSRCRLKSGRRCAYRET